MFPRRPPPTLDLLLVHSARREILAGAQRGEGPRTLTGNPRATPTTAEKPAVEAAAEVLDIAASRPRRREETSTETIANVGVRRGFVLPKVCARRPQWQD